MSSRSSAGGRFFEGATQVGRGGVWGSLRHRLARPRGAAWRSRTGRGREPSAPGVQRPARAMHRASRSASAARRCASTRSLTVIPSRTALRTIGWVNSSGFSWRRRSAWTSTRRRRQRGGRIDSSERGGERERRAITEDRRRTQRARRRRRGGGRAASRLRVRSPAARARGRAAPGRPSAPIPSRQTASSSATR